IPQKVLRYSRFLREPVFFVFGMIITDTCKVRTDFRQKALTSGKSPGSQGLSSVGIPGCGLLPFTLADNLYGP
ncbi:hypothetical protein, partial [Faecalibaculum rodentium]|uniref:hypothetical protein n=1 Tax=Faecalibaculum rodentium TaxID=1702221 RepID=UPI0023F4515B